jgi:purine-nucleoside phosphorylase
MTQKNIWEKINEASDYLKEKTDIIPQTGIILGTGLGGFARKIQTICEFPYVDIPGFRSSTVEGHSGKLIIGTISGIPVIAMQGRIHYYEGYSMDEITFPVKVMIRMGIKTLFVSNAAGGLNPDFVPGDIMIITDHINLFPEHPLRGENNDETGPRFPDMGNAYNKKLIQQAFEIGEKNNISFKQGVYVGTQGPTFETLAEYRYFRIIGGDAVGMSTVPEIIVANHAGLACFGISVIANTGLDANAGPVSHQEVQENTKTAHSNLSLLFTELIKESYKVGK